jgi:BASS family bile acid:Na+ symporter
MLERALSFYTRYFAIWVILGGLAAYRWPAPFKALAPWNLWFFAMTMFGIGAVLRMEDFRRIARNPGIVLVGTVAQFTIMPLGAFLVSRLLGLSNELAIGLILAGSAPGAMSSNVMSYVAKADTAYSVSMTTVSTVLCPFLTPTLTCLLAQVTEMRVPVLKMMLELLATVILPLFFGFAVRHFLGERLRKVLPVFPAISATFIVFICALVIALNRERLQELTGIILLATLALNLGGMAAGYGVGALFRMDLSRRRTLSIEIGMQNAGLGTILALKHFGAGATIPAAAFVFICILTASVAASLWQRHSAGPASAE